MSFNIDMEHTIKNKLVSFFISSFIFFGCFFVFGNNYAYAQCVTDDGQPGECAATGCPDPSATMGTCLTGFVCCPSSIIDCESDMGGYCVDSCSINQFINPFSGCEPHQICCSENPDEPPPPPTQTCAPFGTCTPLPGVCIGASIPGPFTDCEGLCCANEAAPTCTSQGGSCIYGNCPGTTFVSSDCTGLDRTCCDTSELPTCEEQGGYCTGLLCASGAPTSPPSSNCSSPDRCCLLPPDPSLTFPTGTIGSEAYPTDWVIDIQGLLGGLTGFLYPVAIALGFLGLIKAGYKYMTSEGDPPKVKEAQEELTASIIGIVFILLSVFILDIIITGVIGA